MQGGFLHVGDYIFMYAYPLSFLGGISYSIISLLNINISDLIANKNLSLILGVLISITSFISVFNWMNIDPPILGEIVLPNGRKIIKVSQ